MSRKTLRFYRFGESILGEFDLFDYEFTGVHQKYPNRSNNDMDVYQADYLWSWNGYNGYGNIDFYKSSMTLCNKPGENESIMNVSSDSKRKPTSGKNYSTLYNDDSLEPLFNMMLQNLDISSAMSNEEWIDFIGNKSK